jgi:hypothetical protein
VEVYAEPHEARCFFVAGKKELFLVSGSRIFGCLVAWGAGVDTALRMAGLDTRIATLQCISMEAALHCILERSRISVHLGSRISLHLRSRRSWIASRKPALHCISDLGSRVSLHLGGRISLYLGGHEATLHGVTDQKKTSKKSAAEKPAGK